MLQVLIWWATLEIFGWLALPLTMRVFRWLPDRGYAFSKAIGLLVVSYLVWLGASAGFLNNDLGGILTSIVALAVVSGWLYYRQQKENKSFLREFFVKNGKLVLTVELLFAGSFVLWCVLRAYAPDKIMSAGGEKFMETAFLNAILNSRHFPPLDPWLSGFSISYYYFGYVMMAVVTRLTSVMPTVGFDLYDALLFALTAIGAFGVVSNLVAARRKSVHTPNDPEPTRAFSVLGSGLLGALFVAGIGNLEGLVEVIYARGLLPQSFWQWLNIPGLLDAQVTGGWFPATNLGWWWWRASRVIQDLDLLNKPIGVSPITEFPFFSFLLGDNHPHVLGLPFVLLAIGLALNICLSQTRSAPEVATASDPETMHRPAPWWNPAAFSLDGDWLLFGFGALLLGSLAFLNTWDFPIYLGLLVLGYAAARYSRTGKLDRDLLLRTLVLAASLFILAILLYIFFYVGFSSQASGVLPYVFPPTRLPQYLVIFGTFAFILVCFQFVYLLLNRGARTGFTIFSPVLKSLGWVILVCALVFGAILGAIALSAGVISQAQASNPVLQGVLGNLNLSQALRAIISYRIENPWLFLFLVVLMALAIVNWLSAASKAPTHQEALPEEPAPEQKTPEMFVFLLIMVGLALTLVVEFLYLRDSFGVRMNTVFKFYYQAWVMLACACAYGLWWMLGFVKERLSGGARYAILAVSLVLILCGMVYTLDSFYSRAGGFLGKPNLDGASPLAASNPDDWAMINWLISQKPFNQDPPVILEAPGLSYTYEGRISTFTGFPSVLGWAIHESQWRGNYDEQGKREPDIVTIFTSSDPKLTLDLLHKWNVKYVILGSSELSYIQKQCQDTTRNCTLTRVVRKFDQILTQVYTHGNATIYQVP